MLLQLDRSRHVIRDWGFLRYLRRRFPGAAKDLMGYYHRQGHTWVIGRWACRSSGRIAELLTANTPTGFSALDVDDLGFMLAPQRHRSYKAWAKNLVAEENAWKDRQDTDRLQQQDIREFLQKKLPGLSKEDPSALLGFAISGES